MTIHASLDLLRRAGRNFAACERGNVVMLFSLAMIPLMGLTGIAVDYSRASAIKAAMQIAADSAALALSRSASTLNETALNSAAADYFNATFSRPEISSPSVSAVYSTTNGSSVTINTSAVMKTTFLGVVGIQEMPIKVSATSAWGNTRLRVALALDNTGSMASSGKIEALKTASKNLLNQLRSMAAQNGDVYVSVIPFSKDVNVGAGSYTANWIDWEDWDDDNGSDVSTTTCSATKTGRSGRSTKRCSTSTTWVPANHTTWNGCVTDRDKNYDISNEGPDTSKAKTLFPAEQYDYCPVELMPLSYDWTRLASKIDSMRPNGNTNVTIGLVWGWHALTPGAPLNPPAEDSRYEYKKVLILLTDGENTENRFGDSQSAIDERTKKACAAAKAAGITIYTVLVMEGSQSLLKQCASDDSKYFYLASASQLVTAFNQIGTSLTKLRISK
jgi:Flp pilus assembly protein TadG